MTLGPVECVNLPIRTVSGTFLCQLVHGALSTWTYNRLTMCTACILTKSGWFVRVWPCMKGPGYPTECASQRTRSHVFRSDDTAGREALSSNKPCEASAVASTAVKDAYRKATGRTREMAKHLLWAMRSHLLTRTPPSATKTSRCGILPTECCIVLCSTSSWCMCGWGKLRIPACLSGQIVGPLQGCQCWVCLS